MKMTFNRPLTWSERETFWLNKIEDVEASFDKTGQKVTLVVPSNGMFAAEMSRAIVKHVSEFVEKEYLNVHPKAAMTISPKVKV